MIDFFSTGDQRCPECGIDFVGDPAERLEFVIDPAAPGNVRYVEHTDERCAAALETIP